MYSLCKSTYQLNWVCIYIVKENCYNFLNVDVMLKWASTVRLPLHIFYWIYNYFFKRKMCEHGFKFTILFNKLKWIYRYSVHVSSVVGRRENLLCNAEHSSCFWKVIVMQTIDNLISKKIFYEKGKIKSIGIQTPHLSNTCATKQKKINP